MSDDCDKLFFTILDFRSVTNLFADPAFDGTPTKIKDVNGDEPIPPDDDDNESENTSEETTSDPPPPDSLPLPEPEPRKKVYVNGVDVTLLHRTVQIINPQTGKLTTVDLQDFTRSTIRQQYETLNDFLTRWNAAERKTAIIEELRSLGVPFEELEESVKQDNLDSFDLICYIAYGQSPLTRRERADQVKKRDCFTKYGETARKVIAFLLDKYAEFGIDNIEDINVLTVNPFAEIGSMTEIVSSFGGRDAYLNAVREIETQLYWKP